MLELIQSSNQVFNNMSDAPTALQVYIPASQKEWLKAYAKANNISLAEGIRRALSLLEQQANNQ